MTVYKQLSANDKVSTKTLLHEAIPITGTIVHRTYGTHPNEANIQNFTHGMFQSVYDYPYLSSSANHIFDISCGIHKDSTLYASTTVQKAKKNNVYNQMAQVLMGYDKDGSIQKGSFSLELGVNQAYTATTAVMSKRIKISDSGSATSYKVNSPAGEYGILVAESTADGAGALTDPMISGETITSNVSAGPKPSVGLIFYQAGVAVLSDKIFQSDHASVTVKATNAPTNGNIITIETTDGSSQGFTVTASTTSATQFSRGGSKHGLDNLKTAIESSSIAAKVTVSDVQTVTGGFMITITQNTAGSAGNKTITNNCTSYSVAGNTAATNGDFSGGGSGGILGPNPGVTQMNSALQDFRTMLKSSEVSSSADAIRNRIFNLQYNNTIELNSTVYFCRAQHDEFNYSSNPTYLSGSQIRVKNESTDIPISYITSLGLYSSDNQLLAVGKFSEPIRKDNNIELSFRARLDY